MVINSVAILKIKQTKKQFCMDVTFYFFLVNVEEVAKIKTSSVCVCVCDLRVIKVMGSW